MAHDPRGENLRKNPEWEKNLRKNPTEKPGRNIQKTRKTNIVQALSGTYSPAGLAQPSHYLEAQMKGKYRCPNPRWGSGAGNGSGGGGTIEWQRTKSVHKLGMTPHYTWQQYIPPTATCTTHDPCNVIHTSGSIFSV